jgi:hypothetical protein
VLERDRSALHEYSVKAFAGKDKLVSANAVCLDQSLKEQTMKLVIFLTLALSCLSAQAEVLIRFLPFNQPVMVSVFERSPQNSSGDFEKIYSALTLDEQSTVIGPGKGATFGDNLLRISCARQRKLCSFVFSKSPYLKVNSAAQQFRFEVPHSDFFNETFPADFVFESSDGVLRIEKTPQKFLMYNL